jgi:hypothetical protein
VLFGKSAFQDAFFRWKSRDENERRREFTGERLSCDTDLLCLSCALYPQTLGVRVADAKKVRSTDGYAMAKRMNLALMR